MEKLEPLEHYPIEVIHWAGMNDDCLADLQKILNKYPTYINAVNHSNDNALIVAVRTGNLAIMQYLINETDINIHHCVAEGNAITVAAQYNRAELIPYLLKKNISVSVANQNGETPLFQSAKHGNDDLVELFLEYGANINHLDNNNQNILFSFINQYPIHHNYYCFELIQEKLSSSILFTLNKDGHNIIQYMDKLIEEAHQNNQHFRHNKLIEYFTPLYSILNLRKPN